MGMIGSKTLGDGKKKPARLQGTGLTATPKRSTPVKSMLKKGGARAKKK